jgi:vacuolar-type H+-ATPase subunit D/Vma8
VVETTKLRIEFEALKSKVRILEKELDAQSHRENALEKRLLS